MISLAVFMIVGYVAAFKKVTCRFSCMALSYLVEFGVFEPVVRLRAAWPVLSHPVTQSFRLSI